VSDRIDLSLVAAADVIEAFEAHRQLVTGETLTVSAQAETDASKQPGQSEVRVARA
jgi:hypothetical protein